MMEEAIRFERVTKDYKSEQVISDLSLSIPAGKFFALLGPSGCGKTTILRLIGGFEKVTSGKIFLYGEDVTHVPVNQRRTNTVFQQYALFPHLNVFENVAYGLMIKGLPKDVVKARVLNVLRKVRLERHAYKKISQLSGGQQQRVAIARAIVNEPKVLLLDEPLAALDPTLKEKLLVELIELQYELKTTFVYITHDQAEALAVADQMAIMNFDGEIAQIGTPKEVYEFPRTSFVARFVGKTNLFRGTLCCDERDCVLQVPGIGQLVIAADTSKDWVYDGGNALLSVRPEKIEIEKRLLEGFSNHLEGRVDSIIYHGRATEYLVDVAGRIINVFEQNEEHFERDIIAEGNTVNLYWQKDNAVLLEE
jgi:spermidine/putrescine transport system ATP-binding protein